MIAAFRRVGIIMSIAMLTWSERQFLEAAGRPCWRPRMVAGAPLASGLLRGPLHYALHQAIDDTEAPLRSPSMRMANIAETLGRRGGRPLRRGLVLGWRG